MTFLILLLVFNISLHSATHSITHSTTDSTILEKLGDDGFSLTLFGTKVADSEKFYKRSSPFREFYVSEKNSSSIDKKIRAFAHEHNYTLALKKENSIEVYFDTPELTLSTKNQSLKYQLKSETSAPNQKKKKSYQESILYRNKDNTLLTYPIKHYHTIKSAQEKHPLLSLIKRADREEFLKKLKENGILHPLTLRYVVKISKLTESYALIDSKKHKIFILVHKINLESFNIKKNFTTIEMDSPLKRLKRKLNITEKYTNSYDFYLKRLKKDNFYFGLKIKYPYLFRLLNALFNTVFISLFLVLFFYIFSTLFFTIFSKKTSYFD
jgi:hypothetical protein